MTKGQKEKQAWQKKVYDFYMSVHGTWTIEEMAQAFNCSQRRIQYAIQKTYKVQKSIIKPVIKPAEKIINHGPIIEAKVLLSLKIIQSRNTPQANSFKDLIINVKA